MKNIPPYAEELGNLVIKSKRCILSGVSYAQLRDDNVTLKWAKKKKQKSHRKTNREDSEYIQD